MDFARSTHPGVQAQLDRLSMVSPAGDRLGLDRIRDLLERLGRPQDRLPPVFHVAGTNGKGSTIAFLRAAIEQAGATVHVFTSPHLVRFNERIRISGKLIGDEELEALLTQVIGVGPDIQPSFFEVATAVALVAFSRTPADACILEVGLGGRLDATNVIDRPVVGGIASIAMDHQHYLGTTLAEVAGEKAAIAKPGVPLVSLAQPSEAEDAVIATAAARDAKLLLEGRDWIADPSLMPALAGAYQGRNANLAWQMLRAQSALSVSEQDFRLGLAAAKWPARMQRLAHGPLAGERAVWLDGGHNPSAAEAVAGELRNLSGAGPLHLVFASLQTKDPEGMLAPFAGLVAAVHCVPIPGHDFVDPVELQAIATGLGFAADTHDGVAGALAHVPQRARTLIFGSLYLAGTVLGLNDQAPD